MRAGLKEQIEEVFNNLRQGVLRLRKIVLPASGLMIGDDKLFSKKDASGRRNPHWGRPDGTEVDLTSIGSIGGTSTPGGELGGTWAEPTVDATHSGSPHHAEVHSHASHGSIGPDDHHDADHTVVSHSDTTATGAQLDAVTDGSEVGLEHTHRLTTYITIGSETGDGISYTV